MQTRTFVYDSLRRLTSATNPESGTVSNTYDNNGNVLTRTDARSIITTISYDALNRPTSRSYSDGTPAVTYTYDSVNVPYSKGRLTSVSSSVSTTNYIAFDALGRVTSASQVTDGQTYSMSYAYNVSGAQTSMTYPSGRVTTGEYDAAARLAGVRDQASGIYYAGKSSLQRNGTLKPDLITSSPDTTQLHKGGSQAQMLLLQISSRRTRRAGTYIPSPETTL